MSTDLRVIGISAAIAFVGLVGVANWLTARYGLIPVGFGLMATAAAAVDSVLFLALAGLPIAAALPGQMLAKTTAVFVVVLVGAVGRALLRQPQHTEGA